MMTDWVSTTNIYLFPELRSNVINCPVLSLRYGEVNVDYETELDDHEENEDVSPHDTLKH